MIEKCSWGKHPTIFKTSDHRRNRPWKHILNLSTIFKTSDHLGPQKTTEDHWGKNILEQILKLQTTPKTSDHRWKRLKEKIYNSRPFLKHQTIALWVETAWNQSVHLINMNHFPISWEASEWASEQTNEQSGARERSEQCRANTWVCGASKGANGPVLYASISFHFYPICMDEKGSWSKF